MSAGARLAKRSVDVMGALAVLLVGLPVLLVIAITVWATSPGPVLFRQARIGRARRPFALYKFRTMVDGAETVLARDPVLQAAYVGGNFKVPPEADYRVTPMGRFLRRWSLDELPQLINVVRGDMSLVGPRPVVEAELASWGDRVALYTSVRPGITGWWQVNGRSTVHHPQRLELEVRYLERWSFWLDLKILARTVPATLRGRGAY